MSILDEDITVMVRGGYMTAEEIVEILAEGEDEGDEAGAHSPSVDQLTAIVDAKIAARRAQLARRARSNYERLRDAFIELDGRGVLARENYWCCQTCACSAIGTEMAEILERGEDVRGYVLFHSQDTDEVVESGELMLRYGGVTEDPKREGPSAAKEIGAEIVATLAEHGFEPVWSGSVDDVILLPIEWDKPPPQFDA